MPQKTYKEMSKEATQIFHVLRDELDRGGNWHGDDHAEGFKAAAQRDYQELKYVLEMREDAFPHKNKREQAERLFAVLKNHASNMKRRIDWLIINGQNRNKSEQKVDLIETPESELRTIETTGNEKRPEKSKAKKGAGRPAIGTRRVISLNLPDEQWELVDRAIESGSAASVSDYFRQLHVGGSVFLTSDDKSNVN